MASAAPPRPKQSKLPNFMPPPPPTEDDSQPAVEKQQERKKREASCEGGEPAAAAGKGGKSDKQRSLSDTFRSLTASGTDIESLGIETFASLKDSDRRVMQVIGRVIMRAQKVLRDEGVESLTEQVLQELAKGEDKLCPFIHRLMTKLLKGAIDHQVRLVHAVCKRGGHDFALHNPDGSPLLFGDAMVIVQSFLELLQRDGPAAVDAEACNGELSGQLQHKRRRVEAATEGLKTVSDELATAMKEMAELAQQLDKLKAREADAKGGLTREELELSRFENEHAEALRELVASAPAISESAAAHMEYLDSVKSTPAAAHLSAIGFVAGVSKLLPEIPPLPRS